MTRQVLINGDRELTDGQHFQPVYPTLPFAAAERKKKRGTGLGLASLAGNTRPKQSSGRVVNPYPLVPV